MERRIKYSQFQQVKNAAKMIDLPKRKMKPIGEKIAALVAEYKSYQTQISALEAGIVQVMGFHVDDLVKKVIEPTGKTDLKTGKPIMVTKYVETDIVSYDKQKQEYVVEIPDALAENAEEEHVAAVEAVDTEEFLPSEELTA